MKTVKQITHGEFSLTLYQGENYFYVKNNGITTVPFVTLEEANEVFEDLMDYNNKEVM